MPRFWEGERDTKWQDAMVWLDPGYKDGYNDLTRINNVVIAAEGESPEPGDHTNGDSTKVAEITWDIDEGHANYAWEGYPSSSKDTDGLGLG